MVCKKTQKLLTEIEKTKKTTGIACKLDSKVSQVQLTSSCLMCTLDTFMIYKTYTFLC